ncbi:MAG: hypothetical protein M3163_10340 [Actinomycetota bacterium]|nr:hypothetical protein [Actinomycetota bacterium]
MAVFVVALVGGLLFFATPAASPQTGYPPGLCTAVSGTQDLGPVEIGQRFVVQVAPTCLFTPGTPVTVTVNGVDIPGKNAEPGGFVLVDVTVVSATQLSIDDPVLTPAFCGTNTVTARGASTTAQGGIATQSATFTLNCPAPAAGGGIPGAGVATPVAGRLSLTGANSLRVAVAALALVVAGSMLVVVTRRRRAAL